MEIQERKKLLIQQVLHTIPRWSRASEVYLFTKAFSGIKRTETQRERREARMQGLSDI